jgi:hypothetical protein
MKRQPWTPSEDDLRLLSEHLHYEVMMTFGLARFLVETQGTVLNQLMRNAEIEAFTIHVRQLIDFLWTDRSERPTSTDAFASDYFAPREWAKLRPERPTILSDALHRKVGWGVAHLTYGRARSTLQDKQWNPIALAQALGPAVICFADNVDRGRLEAKYLDDIKLWGESVLGPKPPSATTAST